MINNKFIFITTIVSGLLVFATSVTDVNAQVSIIPDFFPNSTMKISGKYSNPDAGLEITFPNDWNGIKINAINVTGIMLTKNSTGLTSSILLEVIDKSTMEKISHRMADLANNMAFRQGMEKINENKGCNVITPTSIILNGMHGMKLMMQCSDIKFESIVFETNKNFIGLMFMVFPPDDFEKYSEDFNNTLNTLKISNTVETSFSSFQAKIPSPRQQLTNGVLPENVSCEEGKVLIKRTHTNSIACVEPQTAQKLVERGWGITTIATIPKLSDDQATQIIRSDLAKHLPNLTKVIIVGKDPIPNNPNYPQHPLRLIYVATNGTQYTINNTNYSVVRKCIPDDPSCFIKGELAIQSSSGRLVYLADLSWYTTETHGNGFATYYLVDANNGKILFSTLLGAVNSTEQMKIEYRP